MDTTMKELGAALSSNTKLILPEDEAFAAAALRWNLAYPMVYSAVVDAASEEDIASTIKYANKHNIPFFAFNGTHGALTSMHKFKNGIGITTLAMKSLTLNEEDGSKTAWIRGSWLSGHIRDELAKLGKRTTHGSCDSTGLIGPMLGGGHGLLQGHYGLLADQVVELRVVLADGSIVTVSENSHPDLFWAMRGAGHNFGVVAAVKYKVYDVPKDDVWSHNSVTFSADKLEELAKILNEMVEKQPVELAAVFPHLLRMPHLDPANPVFNLQILYEGPESANALLAPLRALGPLAFESKSISFLKATEAIAWDFSSISNQRGIISALRFPLGLNTFDVPSMRKAYDHFAAVTAAQPALAYSFVVWEAYSTQGVKAVSDSATAVADRADNMLVAPMIFHMGANAEMSAQAIKFGEELRQILLKGRSDGELHAYVNYAHGYERLEEIYGHQAWRLEKLRKLKGEYDPDNRFGYYAPIA